MNPQGQGQHFNQTTQTNQGYEIFDEKGFLFSNVNSSSNANQNTGGSCQQNISYSLYNNSHNNFNNNYVNFRNGVKYNNNPNTQAYSQEVSNINNQNIFVSPPQYNQAYEVQSGGSKNYHHKLQNHFQNLPTNYESSNKFSKPKTYLSQELNNVNFYYKQNQFNNNPLSVDNPEYIRNNSQIMQKSNQQTREAINSNCQHNNNQIKDAFNMKEMNFNMDCYPVKKYSEEPKSKLFNSKTMSIVEKKNIDDTKNLKDFLNSLDEELIDFVRTQNGSR